MEDNVFPNTRPVTVRVSESVHRELALLARVQGTSIADQARHAVSVYIMERVLSDELDAQVASAKERFAAAVAAVRAPNPQPVAPDTSTKVTGGQMSIRLDQLQLSKLTALSLVDDDTLADQLRHAFELYISKQADDQRLVRARAQLDQEDSIRADLFGETPSVANKQEIKGEEKRRLHAAAHRATYASPTAIEALDY